MQSGAVLKDLLMVDQYELGAGLAMEIVIGQIPFSRHFLEVNLRLREPTDKTLLVVEAGSNLFPIVRGDLVLVDLKQANFARDGVYLIDLPGLELRAMFRRPDGKIDVIAPELGASTRSEKERRFAKKRGPGSMEMNIGDLFGIGRHAASKVVGRAVWVGRAI
jgi:hypothetical protein